MNWKWKYWVVWSNSLLYSCRICPLEFFIVFKLENKKYSVGKCVSYTPDTRMLQMNPPNDWLKTGWAWGSQTRTRLVDSLFCITCSLENNAFSVLRYTTLCYIASRFILPPHSLASSRGCSLAITSLQFGTTVTSFQVDSNNNYFKLFDGI